MQIVPCRMAHERVRLEEGRIVRRCAEGAEDVLARQPLCSKETRAKRLACGHTTARDAARRALHVLRDDGVLSAEVCAALECELQAIGHEIQLLDHRKGDAEKQYALAAEASCFEGATAASRSLQHAESGVRDLEVEHGRQVDALHGWRQRVLAAIDAVAPIGSDFSPTRPASPTDGV